MTLKQTPDSPANSHGIASTTMATLGRAIATSLEQAGLDSKSLFDEVGLAISDCYNPNARFETAKVARLWKRAAELTGDAAFGLKVAQYTSVSINPSFGAAFSASESLLVALQRMCKMFPFVTDSGQLRIVTAGDSIFLEYGMSPSARSTMADEIIDALFAATVAKIREEIFPEFAAKSVRLVRQAPADTTPYDALFRAPIYYGQECDSLEFDPALLCQPLASANPEAAQLNEQLILQQIARAEKEEFELQARFHIISQLALGEPGQDKIAALMNLSARQFRRKLQALGTSYQQMLLATRHDLARKYLRQAMPVKDVAQLLGFADQSYFAKAFKTWEGCTPTAYRNAHGG